MTQTVTFNYEMRPHFREAHRLIGLKSTKALHIGAGRRSGKSVFAAACAAMRALASTSSVAFIAPTLTQAQNIGWEYVLDILKEMPGVEVKRGEALIRVPAADGGTSTIRFFGAADDGSGSGVRGYGFDLVVIDEVAQCGVSFYQNALLPTLSGRENAAIITIGTFRGTDLMYQLHKDAAAAQGEHSLIMPASQTGYPAMEELLALAKRMGGWDSPAFQREYEANMDVADELAHFDPGKIRAAQQRKLPEYDRRQLEQIYEHKIGIDPAFKQDRAMGVVVLGPAVIDYFELNQPTLQELCYKILSLVKKYNPIFLGVDSGAAGVAVIDALRGLGVIASGVGFGERATDPGAYQNRRAELIDRVREWTENANCVLPPGEDIFREITAVRSEINPSNKLVIEPKKSIRQRLGQNSSTDFLDALACALATTSTMTPEFLEGQEKVSLLPPDYRGADGSRYSSAELTARLKGEQRAHREFDPYAPQKDEWDPFADTDQWDPYA